MSPTPHPVRRRLLAALACMPLFAQARPARDAWPLLLAQEAPELIDPAGYLVSEKYDGVRALWDGQRLRFRSGLPVAAPLWFTQRWPALPLDGELWLGRGRFEALSGAVRRSVPDDRILPSVESLLMPLSSVCANATRGAKVAPRAEATPPRTAAPFRKLRLLLPKSCVIVFSI